MSISYYVYRCASMSVYHHRLHDSTQSGQKRALDSLELKGLEVVSCLLWVLGTELLSSGRTVSAVNQ